MSYDFLTKISRVLDSFGLNMATKPKSIQWILMPEPGGADDVLCVSGE